MTQSPDLNIALVGCGTVGTGVVKILQSSMESLRQRTGRSIQLRRVIVQNVGKQRDVDLGEHSGVGRHSHRDRRSGRFTSSIHVVGGISPAREDVTRLLQSGKDVITANKALLYAHGAELFALAGKLNRTICFEAAVAGGIPIISAVNTALDRQSNSFD